MAETPLKTAKFFEPAEQSDDYSADDTFQNSSGQQPSAMASWQRVSHWLSLGLAAAVIVCFVGIFAASLTGLHLPKSANPIDWYLWFGGAKPDQNFEKFVRDTSENSKQEWKDATANRRRINSKTCRLFNSISRLRFNLVLSP